MGIFKSHLGLPGIILVATWLMFILIVFNIYWMRIPKVGIAFGLFSKVVVNLGWNVSWYVGFSGFDYSLSAYWSDNLSSVAQWWFIGFHIDFTLNMYGKLLSITSILDFVLCIMSLCMIVVPIHIQYIYNLIWIELVSCKALTRP